MNNKYQVGDVILYKTCTGNEFPLYKVLGIKNDTTYILESLVDDMHPMTFHWQFFIVDNEEDYRKFDFMKDILKKEE